MRFQIRIEFDGKNYVASCGNLTGCYVQSESEEAVRNLIEDAIYMYRENYLKRHEPLLPGKDTPQLNHRIKFRKISSNQLSAILKRERYRLDIATEQVLLFRMIEFPFNRLLIPNTKELSPMIIQKIFGEQNVVLLPDEDAKPKKTIKKSNDQA